MLATKGEILPAVPRQRALIAHIVFRFVVGGLENGIVNLINHMPEDAYDHVLICVDGYDPQFVDRVRREDVEIHCLDKKPGKDFGCYWRLWRLLRFIKPDLVHTRNLGTIDYLFIAAAAGVPARVHGEHGWDVQDLHGTNRKYRWLRRALSPGTHRFIAVSDELASWLRRTVSIADHKIVRIYNGVDTTRFRPADTASLPKRQTFVIGYAGRFAEVKDPLTLVDAFIALLRTRPDLEGKVRMVMLGDGGLYASAIRRLRSAGVEDHAALPGAVANVAERLRAFDLFVLPSRNEGISNTILEAMASGLPIVATRVGGNPELVVENTTGKLVPPGDPETLATALIRYADAPDLARAHGNAGRKRVETSFGLDTMVAAYKRMYDDVLELAAGAAN